MEIKNTCCPVSLLHKIVELGQTMIKVVYSLLLFFVICVTNINYHFSPNWTYSLPKLYDHTVFNMRQKSLRYPQTSVFSYKDEYIFIKFFTS